MREPRRELSPDEARHNGEPAVARPAATVLLLRGGGRTLEVLMVQRHPAASFMGGVWVFPGGAVDSGEGSGDAGTRAAALRELQEETGISLAGPHLLVPYARWITPREVIRRFDTWFFLAPAPDPHTPVLSAAELIDHRWVTPADALAACERGELLLVLPTIRTLQSLLGYASADAALRDGGRVVEAQEPRVVGRGDAMHLALPGDADYPAD